MKTNFAFKRSTAARRVTRRRRTVTFSINEPRHLLAGLVFDLLQTLDTEQSIAGDTHVVAVDVNGDGDLDLVGLQQDRVLVFDNERGDLLLRERANRPLSAFGSEWTYGGRVTGNADLDGDGDQDLIVNLDRPFAAWIENTDGLGSFTRFHSVTNTNHSVTASDIDSDGDLDLVENEIYQGHVTWYENSNGRGQFLRSHRIATVADGQVRLADIDQDHDIDLVIHSARSLITYTNPGTLLNEWPETTVTEQTKFRPEMNLEVIDLDRNSWPDVIIASYFGTSVVHDVGRPVGAEGPRTSEVPWALFADFNGDQRLDGISWLGGIAWVPQREDSSFAEPQPIHKIRAIPNDVLARDWDSDGDTDLLLTFPGMIQWIENRDGQGNFDTQIVEGSPLDPIEMYGDLFWPGDALSRAVHVVSRTQTIYSERALDWSGDGLDDLIVESDTGQRMGHVKLQWYHNAGGQLGAPQTLYSGLRISTDEATRWTAGDVDGDQLPDLALISDVHFLLYRHSREGAPLAIATVRDGFVAKDIDLLDVDGDGDRDLILIERESEWPYWDSLRWMENIDSRGTFGNPRVLGDHLAPSWSWHDMNGDGSVDLVTVTANSSQTFVRIWTYDAASSSLVAQREEILAGEFFLMVVDVDLDGLGDLVDIRESKISLFRNRGSNESFLSETFTTTGLSSSWILDWADVDGDGDNDLILDGEQLAWLENNPHADRWERREMTDYFRDARFQKVLTTDVEGDQDADLIAIYDNGPIVVLRNQHGQRDWSQNQRIDRADLDAVCLAVASGDTDPRFDIDHNGRADMGDVTLFRERTLGIFTGDLDDDGRFSSSDLVVMMQRGKYNTKGDVPVLWSDGDFNCDGRFDSQDLVDAQTATGYFRNEVVPTNKTIRLDPNEPFNGNDHLSIYSLHPVALQADIDADGDDDLLFQSPNRQTWYRNEGPGRPLVHHGLYAWNTGPSASAVADLDGDGDLDWYVPESPPFWLENMDGQGNFERRHEIEAKPLHRQHAPRFVDWDRDGDLDLIAAREVLSIGNASMASLVLFENVNGQGSFREAMTIELPQNGFASQAFDLADLDGDGWIDVVLDSHVWYRNLQGSWNQTLREPIRVPLEMDPLEQTSSSILAVDLDHDGDADLVRQHNERVFFYYNDGRGQFQPVATDFTATRFAVTDADRNGRWELFLNGRWSEQDADWTDSSRAGFGPFGSVDGYRLAWPPVLLDRDGDGRGDLVAIGSEGSRASALVHESPDHVSWATRTPLWDDSELQQVEPLDVDADGRMDLIAYFGSGAQVQWFRNLGAGKWSEPEPLSLPFERSNQVFHSFDVDGDGDVDLASARWWREKVPGRSILDGPLHRLTQTAIAWHDMDRDGDLDLVSRNQWLANQGGNFTAQPAVLLPLLPGERVLGAGDFDQDGHVDLLTHENNRVYVNLRRDDHFVDRQFLHADSLAETILWDIDRDGDLDVVSSMSQWSENVGGRFLYHHQLDQVNRTGGLVDQALADWDGDGFQDLVTAWSGSNDIVIFKSTVGE